MTAGVDKPFGVGATLVLAVLAMLVGVSADVAVLFWRFGEAALEAHAVDIYDGTEFTLGTPIIYLTQIAVLGWATRLRGWRAADYFGLREFSARDFAVGAVAVTALTLATEIFAKLLGQDWVAPFQIAIYTSTRSTPGLAALFVAVVFIAPLGEEIMFRGFLFRGWASANPIIGIVIIALLWAGMHTQYNWFAMLAIFVFGLLLGWARWRSGSTMLTIALHALASLESVAETVIWVG